MNNKENFMEFEKMFKDIPNDIKKVLDSKYKNQEKFGVEQKINNLMIKIKELNSEICDFVIKYGDLTPMSSEVLKNMVSYVNTDLEKLAAEMIDDIKNDAIEFVPFAVIKIMMLNLDTAFKEFENLYLKSTASDVMLELFGIKLPGLDI